MKKYFAFLLCLVLLCFGLVSANAAFSSQISLDFNALDASNMWNFTTKLGAYSPGISNGVLRALNSVKGHGGFFSSETIATPAVFEFDVLLKGTDEQYAAAYVAFRLQNNTNNPTDSGQGIWMFLNAKGLSVRGQGWWGDVSGSGYSLPKLQFEEKYHLDKTNSDGSKKRIRFYDGGGSVIYIYISLDSGATWEPVGEVRNCISNSRVTVYDVQNGKNNARGSVDVKTLQNPGFIGVWLHEHTYVDAEFANVMLANVSSSNNGKTYSYNKFAFKGISAQAIAVDNSKMTISASVPYDAKLWEMEVEPIAGQTISVDGKDISQGTVNLYAPDGKAGSHTVKCGNDEYTMILYQQAPPAKTGDYMGVRDIALINASDSTLITDYCSIEDYYDGYEDGAAAGVIYAHIKDGVRISANTSVYVAHIKSTQETILTVAGEDPAKANSMGDWSYDGENYTQYIIMNNEDESEFYMYEMILTHDDFEVVSNNRLTTTTLTASDYAGGRNFQQDIFNGVAKDVEGKSYIEFDSEPVYGTLVPDSAGHAVVYMPMLVLGTREESMSYTVYDAEGEALATGRANIVSGSVNVADMTSPVFQYTKGEWNKGTTASYTTSDGAVLELDMYAKEDDIFSMAARVGKEFCRAVIVVTDENGKQIFEDRVDCYYWCGDTDEAIKEMGSPMGFTTGGNWTVVDGVDTYVPYAFEKEGLYHVTVTVDTHGFTASSNNYGASFMKIGKPEAAN